ncbi:MAG TPA: hypothetical protein VND65_01615 [Candidatus Binatia bacterium]|nr:hypothetical protein [Candidatus Binatia bacterium]
MIFDCWTPAASRGHGYYAAAIRQAAVEIQREGKAAWIFSGATNQASLSGILKAGFQHRYTLVRRRRFGASTVSRHNARAATIPKSVAPAASESAEKIAVNG